MSLSGNQRTRLSLDGAGRNRRAILAKGATPTTRPPAKTFHPRARQTFRPERP
jgi:hypothetical protein